MQGRWSPAHAALIAAADCEVWLLTEVHRDLDLGAPPIRSEAMKGTKDRAWAAVWSRLPMAEVPSPHPAAAAARAGELLFVTCVLPWRGARDAWPGGGANTAGRTREALDALRPLLLHEPARTVWGGDWNHALHEREHAGSIEGRTAIMALVAEAAMTVPTQHAPHALPGTLSIDHIAVPAAWRHRPAERIVATGDDGRRLSDHDAYAVDVTVPAPAPAG